MRDRSLPAAFLLGLALVIAALIMSATWRDNVKASQTINVTGSAKQEIVSDFGVFRCTIRGEAATPEAAWRELQQGQPKLLAFFRERGFAAEQVRPWPVTIMTYPEVTSSGRETGRILKYVYMQRFEVNSSDVKRIEALSLSVSSLVEQGVYVEPELPEYHFTRLADLKVEIQALAARDATVRASKIAEASGAKLGAMRGAKMGVLQITPKHSNMVSDYGVNDLSSIEKEITAVVQASFSMR
jgi:hypothetical protein